jgi:hypothetical protein
MPSGSVLNGLKMAGLPLPFNLMHGCQVPSPSCRVCVLTGTFLLTQAESLWVSRSSRKLTVRLVEEVN